MQAEKPENVDFAVRLRGLLESKGLTQVALAERIGLDPKKGASRVGNWCQGLNKPRGIIAKDLADVLEVDPDWLLYGPTRSTGDELIANRISVIQQKVLHEPVTPYKEGRSRHLILNPDYQPSKPSADIEKIERHLAPWMDAAGKSKDIASHIYTQLKLSLPHGNLETLLKSLEED